MGPDSEPRGFAPRDVVRTFPRMSTRHIIFLAAATAFGVLVVDSLASNYGYNWRTYIPRPAAPTTTAGS